VRLVLAHSLRLAAVGLILGTALALALSRLLAAHLLLVRAFDVAGYIGGVTTVLAACLAAAYVPSRRAARVEPLVAMRAD
jgi:putative ABC transport system permease protein